MTRCFTNRQTISPSKLTLGKMVAKNRNDKFMRYCLCVAQFSADQSNPLRKHRNTMEEADPHCGTKQDASVSSKAESLVVKTDRKPPRRHAPNMQVRLVSRKRQTSWATLWRPGATPRPTTGRVLDEKSQIPLSGKFATFRMKPVLGETFMPLGCVIREGGGNADLRAWKAFGHWVNTIRRASPKSVSPEHALYAARKIVTFIQGGDTLSKKVMAVVEESSSRVLSLLKREGVGAHCQTLSERVRRLSERALQKGLECSRRATHKWLSHAMKGGAGPAHRWCGGCTPRATVGYQGRSRMFHG